MNRRTFFQHSGVAALAGFALHCAGESTPQQAAPMQASAMPLLSTVGLQLYTLRFLMRDDFEGPIRQAAAIGYKEFEFAGYGGRSAADIRALLEELNVTAPATHIGSGPLMEDLDGQIAYAQGVGHDYLICPHPGDLPFETIADYRAMAARFNEWGAACKDAGIQFGYHNHTFEFEAIDGTLPMDVLIEETDPELVAIELDLCWATNGGVDPAAYFEKYPGRFHLCHVKDLSDAGEVAVVGTGRVDFASIFANAEVGGLRHYIVEHDRPDDAIAVIQTSYDYLTGA